MSDAETSDEFSSAKLNKETGSVGKAHRRVETAKLSLETVVEELLPRVDADAEWSDEDIERLASSIENAREALYRVRDDAVVAELLLGAMREENPDHAGHNTFDEIPSALQQESVTVQCMIPEYEPTLCSGWETTVEVSPSDVRIDGYGYLHFADHIPTECDVCGDRVLSMNGEVINFHA